MYIKYLEKLSVKPKQLDLNKLTKNIGTVLYICLHVFRDITRIFAPGARIGFAPPPQLAINTTKKRPPKLFIVRYLWITIYI